MILLKNEKPFLIFNNQKIHINKFNKEQHFLTKITQKYHKISKIISTTEE